MTNDNEKTDDTQHSPSTASAQSDDTVQEARNDELATCRNVNDDGFNTNCLSGVMSMDKTEVNVADGEYFRYFIEFVKPIRGTRAEHALRTLNKLAVQPSDGSARLLFTLDEWGDEAQTWIENNLGKTINGGSRLITGNEVQGEAIQKWLGYSGAILQLEEMDGSGGTGTPIIVNRGVVRELVNLLDEIQPLDETATIQLLNAPDYWEELEQRSPRVAAVMKYLSAANKQGREFTGETTPNAASEAAFEAWFYAIGACAYNTDLSAPDIRIRKFGRRRNYEQNSDWLVDLPFESPPLLETPGGVGGRWDEYIILVDIHSEGIVDAELDALEDAYKKYVTRFIGAAQYGDGASLPLVNQATQTSLTEKIKDADGDPSSSYSSPVFVFIPDRPDPERGTLRLAGLYRERTD